MGLTPRHRNTNNISDLVSKRNTVLFRRLYHRRLYYRRLRYRRLMNCSETAGLLPSPENIIRSLS